jgi:hypothetical protein
MRKNKYSVHSLKVGVRSRIIQRNALILMVLGGRWLFISELAEPVIDNA